MLVHNYELCALAFAAVALVGGLFDLRSLAAADTLVRSAIACHCLGCPPAILAYPVLEQCLGSLSRQPAGHKVVSRDRLGHARLEVMPVCSELAVPYADGTFDGTVGS